MVATLQREQNGILPVFRIRFFNQHFVHKPVRVASPIVMPDFERLHGSQWTR